MIPPGILVVEADGAVREMVRLVLSDAGYQVWTWAERAGAETRVAEVHPDLIVLSLWLSQPHEGVSLITALANNPATCTIPLLICSGDLATIQAYAETWAPMGYGVLSKPFKLADLLTLVASLIETSRAKQQGQMALDDGCGPSQLI